LNEFIIIIKVLPNHRVKSEIKISRVNPSRRCRLD